MRLFTGIPVSESFIRAAGGIVENNSGLHRIRWVPAQNLHVTACFIGEQHPDKLPEIIEKIKRIALTTEPIILDPDKICLWPSRMPYMVWALFMENNQFTSLYRRLEEGLLNQAGKGAVKPHITLARFKADSEYEKLNLITQKAAEQLEINHLVLYESKLSPAGPDYYPIADFPFRVSSLNP